MAANKLRESKSRKKNPYKMEVLSSIERAATETKLIRERKIKAIAIEELIGEL